MQENSAVTNGAYESQNIEWKRSWHDDYLKWICGFANAQGGRIYIGKDNAGQIAGLENPDKLLEELPNKIRDQLGLMPHVNLFYENDKAYLEIIVRSSTVPISLRGSYYWRSGSVKQELKGHALTDFLLKKMGMTWDRIVEKKATLDDIDNTTIDLFKKEAATAGRLPDISPLSTDPRNPLIAETCYRIGYIDSWGRGIEKITNSCKQAGLPEPVILERSGGIVVDLIQIHTHETVVVKTHEDNFGITSERIRKEFGNATAKAFEVICQHPEFTAKQLAERLGKTTRTIENYTATLKKAGYITRKGPKRGGYWEVKG